MVAKGTIKADHMPLNFYELVIAGMPTITFTEISGIEEELETVDLPDRTVASGGNTKATEFSGKNPMHHLVEQAALEGWLKEGQTPVSPTYKKVASLIHKSASETVLRTYSLIGLFVKKRKLPDLKLDEEGGMADVEWTFSVDDVLPV